MPVALPPCNPPPSLDVTREPECIALVHGPAGFARAVGAILSKETARLTEAASDDEVVAALSEGTVSVLLVEHSCLAGLGAGAPPGGNARRDGRVPVLALGCPDSAAVGSALEGGATLAARADASPEEIRSLVSSCLHERELARQCHSAQEDLRRHQALVIKDDLTAAYNRRFFERSIAEEIDRARRFGHAVSLIFMDVDNLRDVNRRHGHAVGSNVLREAAARMIRTVRSIDHAVRYGGDEFCVILPETDWRGAIEVAERIRATFAQKPFALGGTKGVMLTASFGVASFPEHATTKEDLVKAADQAMFQVKESRKNGILVAGGQPR